MKITHLGIHIKVADFAKSERFYLALGFRKVFEYGPDRKAKESYLGAVFEHGGTKLEIAAGHRAVKPEVFKEKVLSSKISLMVNVKSLLPIIPLCQQANIRLAVGPRHYYWNTLELVVKDPDGVVLVFVSPYSPIQAKRLRADETFGQPPTPADTSFCSLTRLTAGRSPQL